MIDQDSDGVISQADLANTFKTVGDVDESKDTKLHLQMLKESSTEMNFASFMNLMVKKNTLARSDDMKRAFTMFQTQPGDELKIGTDQLKKNLKELNTEIGDSDVDMAIGGFVTKDGMSGESVFMASRYINSVAL